MLQIFLRGQRLWARSCKPPFQRMHAAAQIGRLLKERPGTEVEFKKSSNPQSKLADRFSLRIPYCKRYFRCDHSLTSRSYSLIDFKITIQPTSRLPFFPSNLIIAPRLPLAPHPRPRHTHTSSLPPRLTNPPRKHRNLLWIG